MTRTLSKWQRIYVDGYDISGDARDVGTLSVDNEAIDLTCIPDSVKGVLLGTTKVTLGTINGVLDPTATTGIHAVMNGAGVMRTVMIPQGMQAAPAQGDPVFMGEFEQKDYMNKDSYISMNFDNTSARATTLLYSNPWGWLLHAKSAVTAVNTAVGIDDYGAATAFGGYMAYMVFAGNGTATISCQDAATNSDGSFAAITGATTGSIDCSTVKYGIVAIGRTADVRRYLRWQVAFGTATTLTFSLGFSRAIR